jgi:hypothetical protein
MKRNKHSLSHTHLTSMDMGKLVPVSCVEVLPGDSIRHNTSALVRVSPLVTPVMHPVTVRLHHWFVPHRIVWPEFEDFITGGPDGMNQDVVPTVLNQPGGKNLLDYLGVPPGSNAVSALPVRGFNKIFNEWYRDADLVTERDEDDLTVPNCAWEKDYFTAARPFSAKGPQVTIPIGESAPVATASDVGGAISARSDVTDDQHQFSSPGGSNPVTLAAGAGASNPLYADLAEATGVDAIEFRKAFAIQRYQEARARYGSRYTEYLRYLGVVPGDARINRPEYLGGGKQVISFSEVLQTAADDIGTEQTPVGTLRGHGIAAVRSNRYRKFFQEHGYVFTLMSVRPKTMYMDSIPRHFLHENKEDFFQKELQTVGQQEVYNREIKHDHTTPDGIFGYTNRYEEYRKVFSKVSSEMRDVLDSWHQARTFETDPALNGEFVTCTPTKRIHAEQTQDVLWVMVSHSIQARRMVSKFGSSRLV